MLGLPGGNENKESGIHLINIIVEFMSEYIKE